jgi:hypothetical protein
MMQSALTSLIFLLLAQNLQASGAGNDDGWPELAGPYLGQEPPGMSARVFAPGIVSTAASEINSAWSPEGDALYYTAWTPETGTRIMEVRLYEDRWTAPEVSPFSLGFGEVDPALSFDGKSLFFSSKRPRPGEGPAGPAGFDLWVAERSESGWDTGRFLGSVVNSGESQVYSTAARDGTLYFQAVRADGHGKADIYRSRLVEGVYQLPENLGTAINSEHYEGDVFIDPDQRYLIVSISGRDDALGGADLYISFRGSGDTWSPAVNMGAAINSNQRDFCPMVTPDGRYLFFSSARRGQNDIYWIDASVIDELSTTANSKIGGG